MYKLLVFQHLDREGPGLFFEIASEKNINLEIIRVDMGQDIPYLDNFDGLIVLGGPMGVRDLSSDNYDWLNQEVQVIKEALIRDLPFIGVCLGSQLLAYAAGGNVETLRSRDSRQEASPEVGWGEVHLSGVFDENDSLMDHFKEPLDVLHWHGDRVLLPEMATLLCSSQHCAEQLFRINKKAYGLQFHAELEDQDVYRLIEEDAAFINLAFGDNGQSILRDQQAVFGKSSRVRRHKFLLALFEKLWPASFYSTSS